MRVRHSRVVVSLREIPQAGGHSQVFYLLARPVHRGEHARPKPLRQLARVAEYYLATLGADCGYTGVLSSNPIHDDYQASYPRFEPYALGDLASVIPKGWRVPRPATTSEGRNCQLFWGLCRLSLRCSDEGLLTLARKMNGEFPVPLSDSEVRETWRSVCRYRVTWRRDGHAPWWLARQSRLATLGGNASGVVRRAGTVLEHDRAPWVKLGISRATWYRRKRETEPYTASTPFRLF